MVINVIFRLIIWFLLTSDLSLANVIIGVVIAFILPKSYPSSITLKEWLKAFWEIIIAIPLAYIEAIEMMIYPHTEEEIVLEPVPLSRPSRLIFLDIFRITFTPKTIVVKHHPGGWYEIHRVRRKKQP